MPVLTHPNGTLVVERHGAKADVVVRLAADGYAPVRRFTTRYPDDLLATILAAKGPAYVGDEVLREEAPAYVQRALEGGILPFVPAEAFAGSRILDFGCGSGASTCILARLFPRSVIVGVDTSEASLGVAAARVAHYRLGDRVSLVRSPGGDALPPDIGMFDYISFSAVYEHLLPEERLPILGQIWAHLRPGGVLFINQLPNRFGIVETHTTRGFPLINYLPDDMVFRIVSRFSRRNRGRSWQTLLRAGIRGGTPAEIVGNLEGVGGEGGRPLLMAPRDKPRNDIELWYGSTSALSGRSRLVKSAVRAAAYLMWPLRRFIIPGVVLAVRKV